MSAHALLAEPGTRVQLADGALGTIRRLSGIAGALAYFVEPDQAPGSYRLIAAAKLRPAPAGAPRPGLRGDDRLWRKR